MDTDAQRPLQLIEQFIRPSGQEDYPTQMQFEDEDLGEVLMTRTDTTVKVQIALENEAALRELLGMSSEQLDEAGATIARGFELVGETDTHATLKIARASLYMQIQDLTGDRSDYVKDLIS
jgi:hypothetical protein